MAALEADGWRIDAHIRVAPGAPVTQGRPFPLDTARHAVVIAFDSVDAPAAAAIGAFVRSGGGLVIGSGASGLAALAAGREGVPVQPAAGLTVPANRRQLVHRPIVRPVAGAVSLEGDTNGSRLVARRVGAGRVVQLGEVETWRLALGSDAGRVEHARYWSRVVALASPRDPGRPTFEDDVAPRAALTAALGPAAAGEVVRGRRIDWEPWLAGTLLALLLAEWGSRRTRGLP
jgi:hypothetical protein